MAVSFLKLGKQDISMRKTLPKKKKINFTKSRLFFIIGMGIWLFLIDSLILDTLNDNRQTIYNEPVYADSITGSAALFVAPPNPDEAFTHLIIVNILIVFSFTMSYISWEKIRIKYPKKR